MTLGVDLPSAWPLVCQLGGSDARERVSAFEASLQEAPAARSLHSGRFLVTEGQASGTDE